jgi:hypothetical protein
MSKQRHEHYDGEQEAHLLALRDAAERIGEELPHLPAGERGPSLAGYGIRVQADGEWLEVTGLVMRMRVKLKRSRPRSPQHAEKLRRLHGA